MLDDDELLDTPIDDLEDELPVTTAHTLRSVAAGLGVDTIGELVRAPRTAMRIESLAPMPRKRLIAALDAWLAGQIEPEAPSAFVAETLAARGVSALSGGMGAPIEVRPAEPERPAAALPPEDREGVEGWAEARGVVHVLRMRMWELHGAVGARLPRLAQDHQMTVADLFVPEQLPFGASSRVSGDVLRTLREAARTFLAAEAGRRAGLEAARKTFLARRGEPPTEGARRFDAALAALAEHIGNPSILPLRGLLGHPVSKTTLDADDPPVLRVALAAASPVTVRLPIAPILAGRFTDASMAAFYYARESRDVALAAIEVARDLLRDGESGTGKALRAWLDVPPWQRALARLGEQSGARAGGREERLAFRVRPGRGEGVEVEVLSQSMRKSGDWTVGRAIAARGAAELAETPNEKRVVDELLMLDGTRWAPRGPDAARRIVAILGALADHPRVWFGPSGAKPARIRRGRVAIALVGREGGHAVELSIAGRPRPPADLLARALPDGSVIDLDEATATVTLARLDDFTRSLVVALADTPVVFPSEGIDPLLGVLQRSQLEVDVALPDELLGRAVSADDRPVARLVPLPGDALHLTVGVRPLAGAPFFEPGTGTARVLAAEGGARVSAHRDFDREREQAEHLLGALPLGDAEREGPWTVRIDDPDRAADVIVALAEAGDAAVLEWPEGDRLAIVHAGRKDLRLRIERKRDWFGVEGEVAIDGTRVALAALLAAAREGHRFVRVGPNKIVALAADLRERLRAADDALLEGPKGEIEAHGTALAALDGLVEGDAQIRASVEWSRARARMAASATLEPEVPPALRAELRPYQREGFRWLARLAMWGVGACLADDMGLGKTVQTLALLLTRVGEGPALVVAPTTVGANWLREASVFAPSLRMIAYRGPGRRQLLDDIGPGDVLVTSYDLLARDGEPLGGVRFGTFVLDEAQAVKNAASRRAAAARMIHADFRIALSGTPIENHLGELWSIFRIISPGLLGGWERFRKRFAIPIERDRDPARQKALARLVRPFLLRRMKAAVAPELPARTETVRFVALSPAERELYETERISAIAALSSADPREGRFAMLAALTRLRRLACHPRLVDATSSVPSSKLAAFLEVLDELRDAGHRALIFSQFTSHLALVREALDARAVKYLYLDGQTTVPERERLVTAFQAGEGELFLLSLKAGGSGINLTGADYVVHLDPWWNPAAEDQATDRAHRIGQSRPVTVVRLVARGTIEEAVLTLHAEKRELAESLLAGGELAGTLSASELVALVRAGDAAPDEEAEASEGAPTPGPPPVANAREDGAPPRLASLIATCERDLATRLASPPTARAYGRVLARFLAFSQPDADAPLPVLVERYLGALRSGAIPAKKSDLGVAQAALAHLVRVANGA